MKAIIFLVLIFPSIVSAEITVRTGDHADFSRIVLTVPVGIEWKVLPTEAGAEIQFGDEIDISLEGFFDRIQRDRISDAKVVGGNVVLGFACNCEMVSYLWKPDSIVVDVRNSERPFEEIANIQLNFSESSGRVLPVIFSARQKEIDNDAEVVPVNIVSLFDEASSYLQVQNIRNQQIEAQVSEDLARAASLGLLELSQSESIVEGSAHETFDHNSISDTLDSAGIPGLLLHTSMETPNIDIFQEDSNFETSLCPEIEYYDLENWGTQGSFLEQLSEGRALLAEGNDEIQIEKGLNLAKTYLYFGFGREALQLLNAGDGAKWNAEYIPTLAQLIDGDQIEDGIPEIFTACDSNIAFWAFISSNVSSEPNTDAIMRTFRSLPLQLQIRLAPELAKKLKNIDENILSEIVLAVPLSNSDGSSLDGLVGAVIAVESENSEPSTVSNNINEILKSSARITLDDVLVALKHNNEADILSPIFLLEEAARLRYENRNHPNTVEVGVEEIISHLALGDFESASSILSEIDVGVDRHTELAIKIDIVAVERMNNAEFLNFAMGEKRTLNSLELDIAIKNRLTALGFADESDAILFDAENEVAESVDQGRFNQDVTVSFDSSQAQVSAVNLNSEEISTSDTPAPVFPSDDRSISLSISSKNTNIGAVESVAADGWPQSQNSTDALVAQVAKVMGAPAEAPRGTLTEGYSLLDNSSELRGLLQSIADNPLGSESVN